jgi:hypothetical protein
MGDVTIKEYIDSRIAAQDKAVESALAALNRAATKDDAKLSMLLSALALLVSACTFLFIVMRR